MIPRIGFDGQFINDRYHGIGRYAYNLFEAVTRKDAGKTFVLFVGNGENSRFDLQSLTKRPNVEVKRGPKPLYAPSGTNHLARAFEKIQDRPFPFAIFRSPTPLE